MLKHPDLTRRRIEVFLEHELRPRRVEVVAPLKIEFCETPAKDQASAERGPWREVAKGFEYGPAYRVCWFRLSGVVPAEAHGRELGLVAEVGSERTLWRDGSPYCGIDVEHGVMNLTPPESVGLAPVGWASGEVSFLVQAYTRNSETRVHGYEPPRREKTEVVDRAEIVAIDRPLQCLIYDLEFGLGLLGTLDPGSPEYHTLLRSMNEVTNVYERGNGETIVRARRIVKEALTSLNGEVNHTIYPVGHAHLDTAWLWPLEITQLKMAHTTATQLGLIERYPEYVFAHSQASQYEWIEREYPALFERIRSAVAKGQWEPVGSMWVEADCNLTGAESLVRQFLYGRRYFRDKLGVETSDMWLPDVFGYAAALPQILSKFNISYFLTQKMSWNQMNKFPHHTFWWQGIDGTRVWTHFPPADTYNASCEPKEVLFSVKNYRDHARADQSLYLFGFGDGGGGPTERHLEFLRRGRIAPNYPTVANGKRAIDFFREAKRNSKDLMTWFGELYGEFHRGTYTSQAANKRGNRHSEFLLRDAELLACFTDGFPESYPQKELERVWKLVLLNQFHDIIPGSSVREVYEDSDRDYTEIASAGQALVGASLRKIAGKFDTSQMGRPVALFQNASTSTQAAIPWDEEAIPGSLVTAEETLPVQLIEEFQERKLIFATPTSALGTVAVGDLAEAPAPVRSRLKASARRIESGEWSVRFDPYGNITSVRSLEDGAEYIEQGKLANLFTLFEDKPNFWSAWDIDAFAFEKGTDLVRSDSFDIVERGPVRIAVEVVRSFGNSQIRQRISLGPTPGIRFDTEVDWHEEDKLLKVAFPVNIHSPRATYEIQFGNVERPTHMNTSWDMARFEVCAQKWVDLSEGDQGVALLNESKYGHDIHGNVMRLSLLKSAKAPDPVADMGRHRFSYVLLPHFGPYNYAGVVQAAYALNAPLRSLVVEKKPGEGGALPVFVSCDSRNLVVETVKKAEDSDELIVRLYECHNARGRAELACARAIESAVLCDLEENEIGELEVVDGLVTFDFRPFEILTIKLRV